MAQILPTRTDLARYSFDVELDDVTFSFSFEWNDRDQGWYFSILDVNQVPVISGRRVIVGYPLISLYREPGFPLGTLVAIDTSSKDEEPGFADLGERVKLLYLTRAEIGA